MSRTIKSVNVSQWDRTGVEALTLWAANPSLISSMARVPPVPALPRATSAYRVRSSCCTLPGMQPTVPLTLSGPPKMKVLWLKSYKLELWLPLIGQHVFNLNHSVWFSDLGSLVKVHFTFFILNISLLTVWFYVSSNDVVADKL